MFLLGWKEKTDVVGKDPIRRPLVLGARRRARRPRAPRCRAAEASASSGSRSTGCPTKCTGTIALVRGVSERLDRPRRASAASPRRCRRAPARRPQCTIVFSVATKVIGVVTTSSPGPMPRASSAACRPAVAEETGTAKRPPTYSRKSAANRSVFGPGRDPARAERVDDFADLFFAEIRPGEGKERRTHAARRVYLQGRAQSFHRTPPENVQRRAGLQTPVEARSAVTSKRITSRR